MAYEIALVETTPVPLASVKKTVPWPALATNIRAMFDRVYQVLRGAGVTGLGHNVCVYRQANKEGVLLEVGVITREPFTAIGDVEPSVTPHGRAARTVHTGDYSGLGAANDAITTWIAAQGLQVAGASWEVYGDWHDDPARVTTEVFWRVA